MLVCQQCGAEFPVVLVLRGKPRDLRGRKHCVDCRPYRELGRPRKPVIRAAKALICAACGNAFPAKQLIDGKMHSLYRRRFCLDCSPFGTHNTSKIPPGLRSTEERDRVRRERRRESFRRSLPKRRRKRKRDLVEMYGGRCVDCGYSTCVEALQFHHRDPSTKDFRLGEFNGSLARLLKEAEKCDLVCAKLPPAQTRNGGKGDQCSRRPAPAGDEAARDRSVRRSLPWVRRQLSTRGAPIPSPGPPGQGVGG